MGWPAWWPGQRQRREQASAERLAQAVVPVDPTTIDPAVPRVACIWPDVVALSPSQQYAWCRCGLSANGLWCDGSHRRQAPAMEPMVFSPPRAQHYWLCTCKQTRTPPYCDASHHRLKAPNLASRQ